MKGKDLIYQANYKAGMRILQVLDYDTGNVKEVGYFDTFPSETNAKFKGAWSVYPYFESGLVVISGIEEGLFLVKPDLRPSLVRNDDCDDDEAFQYKKKSVKGCEWVRKSRSKRHQKLRCRKTWQGFQVSHYCRETCGEVGLGPRKCRAKRANKRKWNSARNADDPFQMIEAAKIDTGKTDTSDAGVDDQRRKHRKYIREEANEDVIPL